MTTVEALQAELAVVRRERDLLRALDDATVRYLEGWSPRGFASVWVLREKVAAEFEAATGASAVSSRDDGQPSA